MGREAAMVEPTLYSDIRDGGLPLVSAAQDDDQWLAEIESDRVPRAFVSVDGGAPRWINVDPGARSARAAFVAGLLAAGAINEARASTLAVRRQLHIHAVSGLLATFTRLNRASTGSAGACGVGGMENTDTVTDDPAQGYRRPFPVIHWSSFQEASAAIEELAELGAHAEVVQHFVDEFGVFEPRLFRRVYLGNFDSRHGIANEAAKRLGDAVDTHTPEDANKYFEALADEGVLSEHELRDGLRAVFILREGEQ
ncbi:MAG: hypothetical protein R3E83_19285 [Burkholderiaceae bacterium]